MAPFYGWGSTASRLKPLRGGSLLFTFRGDSLLFTFRGDSLLFTFLLFTDRKLELSCFFITAA